MATAEVIAEDEVTPSNLAQLFKRAFLRTSTDRDGDLIVETDGPRVLVTVDSDLRLIKFMTLYGLNESSPVEAKHAFVNRMNDSMIFCRFSVPQKKPDVLMVDYFLPYEEGIPEFQIVSALRLFARVIPAAIRGCDGEGLLE